MSHRSRIVLLTAVLVLVTGAAPKAVNWSNMITPATDGGPVLGNPKAEVTLVEYASYSEVGNLRYNLQADSVLRLAYVPSGRVSIEVRQVPRNPVDATAAMLVMCGPRDKFFLNHAAMLRSQPRWTEAMTKASPSQRQRWTVPDLGTRNRAIASDLKLYDVMASRGYDRQSLERCLNDKAMATRIEAQRLAAIELGVTRTPAFAINGNLLEGVHDWATLRPKLDESLK